jgi:1-acyl-sn-glycerol-3-phosphate acyltransferase
MLSPLATDILAVSVLAIFAGSVLLWMIIVWWRTQYTPTQAIIFAFNYVMCRVLWRASISGRVRVPQGRGAVFVCNHRGPIDPAFIALTVYRPVSWLVAKEYCLNPVLAGMMRIVKAIPVGRMGVDTAATKLSIRCAQEGGLVGLFPEGRINTTDSLLLPGRPGAALIAIRARVPVIPCYISGSPYDGTPYGCLMMPAVVHLKVGRPIDISEYYGRNKDRKGLEKLTKRFLREIAALAGDEDHEAELAGRFYKPGHEPAAGK